MTYADENRALVRLAVDEVVNGRNLAALPDLVATDFAGHGAGGGTPMGRPEFDRGLAAAFAAFPDIHVRVEDLVAEGDRVAVRTTVSGARTGSFRDVPPSGSPISLRTVHVLRIEWGRIAERWGSGSELGLMRQLGHVAPNIGWPERADAAQDDSARMLLPTVPLESPNQGLERASARSDQDGRKRGP